MNHRYLLRRLGFVVVASYVLLSAVFFFVALTPDPNEVFVQLAAARGGGDTEAALEQYRAWRNRDRPLLTRYADWLVAYSTFNWGVSPTQNEPVMDLLVEHIPRTLSYAVPGMALASLGGLVTGMWNALRSESTAGRAVTWLVAVVGSFPSFFVGYMVLLVAVFHFRMLSLYAPMNPRRVAMAAVTLGLAMLAIQMRYARSNTERFLRSETAKLVRMKGGTDWTLARHAVRLFGASFLALSLTEALGMLFMGIYIIETVFEIPGVGLLGLQAINQRDIPLILGTTFVPVLFGLLTTLLQDVVQAALDPRIGE